MSTDFKEMDVAIADIQDVCKRAVKTLAQVTCPICSCDIVCQDCALRYWYRTEVTV